jgi:PAS domain S-box-containing protein
MTSSQRPGKDPHAENAALRRSEQRYRVLFETIPQPVLVVDTATLAVLAANAAAGRQYGYTGEEWSKLTLHDLRAADAPPLADVGPAPGTFTVGEFHRRRDGSLFPVEVVIGPLDFDGRPAFVGIVSDVTERRRAEDALRVSEARFRALVESGSDAVLLVARDGTILYRSPPATRILGYSPTERVGEVVLDLIHPEDRKPARDALARAVARPGETVSIELRAVHEDRSLVALECVLVSRLDDPAIRAVVVHYRDARRRAEP